HIFLLSVMSPLLSVQSIGSGAPPEPRAGDTAEPGGRSANRTAGVVGGVVVRGRDQWHHCLASHRQMEAKQVLEMRRAAVRALVVPLAACVALLLATPVRAHNVLTGSDPENGAKLAAMP